MRKNYYTGAKWEKKVAYARAARIDSIIEVSGTTAVSDKGEVLFSKDAYNQTKYILNIIKQSIEELGGDIKHVIRTRIYVIDISRWEEIGRAHQEIFQGIDPTTSMVQVSGLIDPEMLVEIEATAVLPSNQIRV